MRYASIKDHLKPYSILGRRRTTINHAFAAAIAPSDEFDDERVREAIRILGQNPDKEIRCVYCGRDAETWDHVHATVKESQFSGHGHRLGNLLPCCKPCNSKKGNKEWEIYLRQLPLLETEKTERASKIATYLQKYGVSDSIPVQTPEYEQLLKLRLEVLEIFERADRLAEKIRSVARAKKSN